MYFTIYQLTNIFLDAFKVRELYPCQVDNVWKYITMCPLSLQSTAHTIMQTASNERRPMNSKLMKMQFLLLRTHSLENIVLLNGMTNSSSSTHWIKIFQPLREAFATLDKTYFSFNITSATYILRVFRLSGT